MNEFALACLVFFCDTKLIRSFGDYIVLDARGEQISLVASHFDLRPKDSLEYACEKTIFKQNSIQSEGYIAYWSLENDGNGFNGDLSFVWIRWLLLTEPTQSSCGIHAKRAKMEKMDRPQSIGRKVKIQGGPMNDGRDLNLWTKEHYEKIHIKLEINSCAENGFQSNESLLDFI